MRKLLILLFLFLGLTLTVSAEEIPFEPDMTLLSTAVGTITVVDSFLVSASPDGISVYLYDDSLQQFDFIDRVYLDIDSVTAHSFDTLLIIDSRDGDLHFLSLNHLPSLPYLGSFTTQIPIADIAYFNNHIYLSSFFDGILRYDISDLMNPQFVDSSMKGILVTELDVDDQYLYALDEYNGLLRYELTPAGFGDFVDYLFVPFRAFDFARIDSLFFLSITSGGVLVGDFNQPGGESIVDSITNINQVEKILFTDSLYIFISQREMVVRDRIAPFNQTFFDISENIPGGEIYAPDSSLFLLLANIENGLTMFDIHDSFTSFEGLTYSGIIRDMYYYQSQLYVSGSTEAITVYNTDSAVFGDYSYTIYEHLKNTSHMQHNGDSLFAVYPDFQKLTLLINSNDPDSILLENSITISSGAVKDMYYYPAQIYDNALLLIQHPFSFEVLTVSDSGYIVAAAPWNFVSDITSIAVKDTTAYITDTKNEFRVLRINEFYEKEILQTISMSGPATESVIKGDTLYVFQEDELYLFNISDPISVFIDTVIELTFPVLDARLVGEHLFGVGFEGVSVFDLSKPLPELIAYGGMSGDRIAADSTSFAITSGSSLQLYHYDIPVYSSPDDIDDDTSDRPSLLSQNYPNPFNLETLISFTLPKTGQVKLYVFNILGQQVTKLVDGRQEAGYHSVSWDGKNSGGQTVASGMYLYKLVTEDVVETRKMILLK